jgi:hypothetical protein
MDLQKGFQATGLYCGKRPLNFVCAHRATATQTVLRTLCGSNRGVHH